jgi:hypothetical protein
MSWIRWVWSVGFDGAQIFGAASRTFFDREARARDRKLLFGSAVVFFAAGPLMVIAGLKGWLYRDLRPLDNTLDRLFLGVTTILPPFHRFFIHHPEELGAPFSFPSLETPMWVLLGATCVVYAARQIQRFRAGDPINGPKCLLLAAVVPLHWLTLAYLSWQAAVPTVTIVHNLQYHAIVWFHNRNRYAGDGRHGRIPAAVTRSLLGYAAAGLAFSLLYRVPGFQLGKTSDLAFGFFRGFGLNALLSG